MAKRIKNLSDSELIERREKRRKKADHDKENYHKFYARSTMSPAEWEAIQVKCRKD